MITALSIGELTINSDDHYGLLREQGLSLPPIRTASFDLAGQHRGAYAASYYGTRRFGLDLLVIGDSATDFLERRDLVHRTFDIQNGQQTLTFTLSDGRVVTLEAIAVTFDFPLLPGRPSNGECHIELEAANPFFLGASEQFVVLTLGSSGGGKVPPDTMPMGLSYGTAGPTIVTNAGTAASCPRVRIYGPINNPALRNQTVDQELRFAVNLAAGQYLDVDFCEKTITNQAGVNYYAVKTGDWWDVRPGTNALRLVADSTSQVAKAEVRFAASYLAI